MSNYLIELFVIHVVLILGYWLFLRKERQYDKMRLYLLGSTFLALIIPLIKLPKLFSESVEPLPLGVIQVEAMTITSAADTSGWPYDNLLIWLYIAVSGFFLFKFCSGVCYLIHLAGTSRREKFNDGYIRKVRNIKGSFTFFNWIFLNDEIEKDQSDYAAILKHEKAHVSLGHTYDLIFFGLFKVFFWWIPTAWFVNTEIRAIHEYQADSYALKSCNVDRYTSILISSTLRSNGLIMPAAGRPSRWQAGLASSFHDNLILKRLIAMKQQAKNVSPWKLGVLSALCALLFAVFACSEEPGKNKQDMVADETGSSGGKIFTVVEAQPEFEGGLPAFRKYIMTEIKYPLEARQKGVEGRVDVEFVVGKDGSLSDVKAVKGIGAGCDEEAVRVLQNAPAFKPGTQNGKPVFVRMVVPVTFKLDQGQKNADNSTKGIIVIEDVEQRNEKFRVDARYANGAWLGTIYDEEGEGLPGANIVAIGTTNGTTTGSDGTFTLKADQSAGISVSFIGYETVKLKSSAQ